MAREERQAHERALSEAATIRPTSPPPDASLVRTLTGLVTRAVAITTEVVLVAIRTPIDAGLRVANSVRR